MSQLVLAGDGVLGERAPGDAEDVVADAEAGDVRADGNDGASDVLSEDGVLRCADPETQAQEVGLSGHEVQGASAEGGGVDLDQYFAGSGGGLVDVAEVEDVGVAVPVLHDGFHGVHDGLLMVDVRLMWTHPQPCG